MHVIDAPTYLGLWETGEGHSHHPVAIHYNLFLGSVWLLRCNHRSLPKTLQPTTLVGRVGIQGHEVLLALLGHLAQRHPHRTASLRPCHSLPTQGKVCPGMFHFTSDVILSLPRLPLSLPLVGITNSRWDSIPISPVFLITILPTSAGSNLPVCRFWWPCRSVPWPIYIYIYIYMCLPVNLCGCFRASRWIFVTAAAKI